MPKTLKKKIFFFSFSLFILWAALTMLANFRHTACHVVKSLQLIWGLGTHITHLRVPDPQTGCIHLKIGHQDSSSSYDHQSHISPS